MNDFKLDILSTGNGKTVLYYVGQAGFIVKSKKGQLLGVDLYLSECVERIEGHMGFKRLLPKLLSPYDIEFDCIVATHPHLDHFDEDSIPQLMSNRNTKLFASLNCENEVKRLHMVEENVDYIKPGDTRICGDFKLDFINCDHGEQAIDAVGVIITVDNKKILMVGDSSLRLDRKNEYLKKGPINIMIAPINGASGNLNEEECVELSRILSPELTIPCHYGMFASHGGNPGLFIELMKEKCPQSNYLVMAMGERFVIND